MYLTIQLKNHTVSKPTQKPNKMYESQRKKHNATKKLIDTIQQVNTEI